MSVLRKQASDHMLRVASAKQATDGTKALATLVAQNTSMLRFPSFVNAWAATGNKTIGELEKRLGQKTMKTLSDAMRSPESAANLLESLPPSERSRVIQFLNNPGELKQQLVAPTIRSVTNALAPSSTNVNALAEPTYRVEIRGTSTSGKK
jgi:anion-transporting  ArsA/GET3 family ATPase